MAIKIFLRIKPIVMTIHKSVQEYYIEPVGCFEFGATFNAIFNKMPVTSCISWRSVLLVSDTGVPELNHLTVAIHGKIVPLNVV